MTVRRDLPIWLGLIGGLVVLLELFLNVPIIKEGSRQFLEWRVVMAAVALALGGGNMIRIHGRNISQRRPNWVNSIVLLTGMTIVFFMGVTGGTRTVNYRFMFDNMLTPLGATVFSMNAFYLTSACYRAFRVRNAQAAVLLLAGTLVMLGKVGIGASMWSQFPVISDWIMNIPNSAAMRGMSMGAALGMVGVSIRIILGLERGHLGGAQ